MADRLYTTSVDMNGQQRFIVFDFERRSVRAQLEHPHPEQPPLATVAPFYVDNETFWMVVKSIGRWDEGNEGLLYILEAAGIPSDDTTQAVDR